MSNSDQIFDVVVVGAGPAGLSCAIQAVGSDLSTVVLDKGSIVDAIRRFPTNLIWFSTPELLEIGDVPFLSSTVRPTRVDTLNYYQKVARYFNLDVRQSNEVVDIALCDGVLEVRTRAGRSFAGRTVVVATGYFDHPNRLSVPGESLPGVFHYYDEPYRYAGSRVSVVGGRNSAVEAALDLYRHGARVTLIHRGKKLSEGVKYWVLPDIENRIKAGEIRAFFGSTVEEIGEGSVILRTPEGRREVETDFTFVLIGFHPDTKQLEKFGVRVDEATLAPVFDPKTYETNVPGLYVAGSLVAGRNNNKVFVENGRLHGKVIVPSILSRLKRGIDSQGKSS